MVDLEKKNNSWCSANKGKVSIIVATIWIILCKNIEGFTGITVSILLVAMLIRVVWTIWEDAP